MNGNCHFIYGAVWGTVLAINVSDSREMSTLFVLGGVIGGILPDIDNPSSYIGKLTTPISTVIGKAQKAFGKEGANHRGIFHDPIIYLTGLILSCLYFPPLTGLFAGCLTHLYLDMFNPSGIPFLFGVKHLHLGKMRSGSKESIIFTWINVIATLIIGIIIKLI